MATAEEEYARGFRDGQRDVLGGIFRKIRLTQWHRGTPIAEARRLALEDVAREAARVGLDICCDEQGPP